LCHGQEVIVRDSKSAQPGAARDLAYWGPKSMLGLAVGVMVGRLSGHSAGQARERNVGRKTKR